MTKRNAWILASVAVAAALFCGVCAGIGSVLTYQTAAPSFSGNRVTKAKYDKVFGHKGPLAYSGVVGIIGFPGTPVSDTPGAMPVFIWANPDGSNMTCTFRPGDMELMMAEQSGLK